MIGHKKCITKNCAGVRVKRRDFGDNKHCSKCLKNLKK